MGIACQREVATIQLLLLRSELVLSAPGAQQEQSLPVQGGNHPNLTALERSSLVNPRGPERAEFATPG